MINLDKLTSHPGVYFFKDKSGQVIYVGKAINLKNRVSSYFVKNNAFSKQRLLTQEITKVDTIEVENELEALILEANMIKKFNPYFNIRLKDDKDYLYIKMTKEPFPRVLTARKKDLADAKIYFGPYPNSTLVRKTLKNLRRVFKFCAHPPNVKNQRFKPCFWYHLRLCTGACVGQVDKGAYNQQIKELVIFLEGNTKKLVKILQLEMEKRAKEVNFEEAARLRDQLSGISYLTQNTNISGYLENNEFRKQKRKAELEGLGKILSLKGSLSRIEAYDISHQSGQNTTASMVVLTDGEPNSSLYRHFKIKSHTRNDDFASMTEVLSRRLTRLVNNDAEVSFGQKPDLLIIDGGKGQLSVAVKVLSDLNLQMPVISLAKKEEVIYLPDQPEGIRLSKMDPASLLVQRIRDEAHRFALRLHRNLKGKFLSPEGRKARSALIDTLRSSRKN